MEYRLVRADGSLIWVRDSGRVELQNGAKLIYGIVSNISERKQAEETLKEERLSLARRVAERTADLSKTNEELVRAVGLKDEFLANMSHELRTPLNAILGMAEALQEQVYGPLNPEQLTSLRHIEEGGRHLLELINDILDVSKFEAGQLELHLAHVSVEELCQASLRFIKQMVQKKQISVSFCFDQAVMTLQADERRLKQILVNLLTNAVKFTPERGQVGLEVSGDAEQGVVRFTVWDTGIGIVKADMGRLFNPFVQLDARLSREQEGTGLGLALVARLTELHGGSVSLESEGIPGRGSRFSVCLPWSEVGTAEPPPEWGAKDVNNLEDKGVLAKERQPLEFSPPQGSEERPGRRPLILLAEDNEANIATLSSFLGKKYQVAVAHNGAEAIERARKEGPDLILMDIQMPIMDGLEAIQRIRADIDLAGIPIIALTALAMPGDRERCLAAGADDYLSKPVSMTGLLEAVAAQLRKQAA
jgi:signal transduction histidine kinase/ActR/RegA family two-component response regulator